MMLRDNAARAQQTILFFQALSGVLVLVIFLDFWYLNVLPNGQSEAEIDASPLGVAHNLLAFFELVVMVVSFVLFIRWLRRAYWNLHALGLRTEHSEGWAAGAWFVPVLNLFRPYTIAREVWRETQIAAVEQVSPHGLLQVWWMFFVLHSLVSNGASQMSGSATTPAQLESATWGNIITAVLMLGTAVCTVLLVQRIAGFDEQLALRLQVSRIGEAAPQPAADLLEDQPDYEY